MDCLNQQWIRLRRVPILLSLLQHSHNSPIHARDTRLRPFYTDHAQSHALEQVPPLSLRPLHSAKGHHAEVHQGRNGRSASVREHLVHDDDAGVVDGERGESVGENLAAGDVGPVVEDVAEEVDRCP